MSVVATPRRLCVTSIATPLDRAWERYRVAVQEVLDHPTEAAVLRRDTARKEWLALFSDRAA